MRKLIFLILPWLALIIISAILYKQCSAPKETEKEYVEVVKHNMVINKIEAIGKLELVKYHIKDIVEHTTEMDWWPDPKVVLIVSGEVAACVDLSKVDSTDISIKQNEITVMLPAPEVCYFKVNHEDSKVYNVDDKFLDQGKLIDKAYRQAEAQVKAAALKMGILEETKKNAQMILKPMLESFSEKKVVILFK
jgi:hypothetical protein